MVPTEISNESITVTKRKRRPTRPGKQISDSMSLLVQILVHVFCLVVYLVPIFTPNPYGSPTLDEMHIMGADNKDIQGDSSLREIFSNDYWGRPMNSESSHKSWRPLTVLSFRYLKGFQDQLTTHRVFNIVTHAAAAEVVGILALRLFRPRHKNSQLLLRMMTKLVFALHPTHVEVTANCANRNHILAVLFSTIPCDPICPLWLFVTCLVAGFLCSETYLFQVPAAMVTLVVLQQYRERQNAAGSSSQQSKDAAPTTTTLAQVVKSFLFSALAVLPRIAIMVGSILVYLGGRIYFDTLNIPEGLIRPAENPFYHFTGDHRVRNYLYTLGIHVAKSWGVDPIGFSHEYGFDCIPAINDWKDTRLHLPFGIVLALVASLVVAFSSPYRFMGPIAIHWAWLLTLFPVAGFLKVGTFVSDRIVVASTVSVSLWLGFALFWWISEGVNKLPAKPLQSMIVGWLFMVSYLKVHQRSLQWMDSISLFQSSLVTCPRFAKVHMELSKIYSGLFADLFNLGTARAYLNTAHEIDPDLCDLHMQYAHVAIQQGNYLEYEEELTQAVLCPFTMGGALPRWQQYWQVAVNNAIDPSDKADIQARQNEYTMIIQQAVQEEQRKQEGASDQAKESPIVGWQS